MKEIFLSFLEISFTTGIIILIISAVSSFADKKFSAKWKYWIWLIIALRLVIPFTPDIDFAPAKIEVPVPDKAVYYIPAVEAPEDEFIHAVVPPQGSVELGVTTVMPSPEENETIKETEEKIYTVLDVLGAVWISGGCAFLICYTGAYFVFRKRILAGVFPADEKTAKAVLEAKTELGIKKNVEAAISKNITSPMVMGFIKPRLLLPADEYGERELYYILKHELTHYKRRDTLYKALLLLANTLHWFNPLVWHMRRLAGTDLELSCDAAVVEGGDMNIRKEYSRTILASVHKERTACTVFSTHFYGGAKTLKKRFMNILSTEKRKKGTVAFTAVILAAAMLGTTVACTADRDMPTEGEVIKLLQSAEAVYQPGNSEVLKAAKTEVLKRDRYYDEITNFEKAVSEVFSENGKKQLFQWFDGGLKPAFYSENGKYFRQSHRNAEDSNVYYDVINSVELLSEEDGFFIYEIDHTDNSILFGPQNYISYAVIIKEGTRFLVEDFDSKRYEHLERKPNRTKGPVPEDEQLTELIRKAEDIYQPGNTEVFETKTTAVRPFRNWPFGQINYDEVINYDEAVAEVFSKRGIAQLENTKGYGYQVFSPIIKQELDHQIPPLIAKYIGKTFRISKSDAGVGATYYDEISSVELIRETDGYFVFRICHKAEIENGETFDVTSTVSFVYEDGKLLINDIFSDMERTFFITLESDMPYNELENH